MKKTAIITAALKAAAITGRQPKAMITPKKGAKKPHYYRGLWLLR